MRERSDLTPGGWAQGSALLSLPLPRSARQELRSWHPDRFPENLGGVEAGLALPGVHSPSHAGS